MYMILFGGAQVPELTLIPQEKAVTLQEFQGVPLLGIVAGGDDDATDSFGLLHGHLGGGRGGDADVPDVVAGAGQGSSHGVGLLGLVLELDVAGEDHGDQDCDDHDDHRQFHQGESTGAGRTWAHGRPAQRIISFDSATVCSPLSQNYPLVLFSRRQGRH